MRRTMPTCALPHPFSTVYSSHTQAQLSFQNHFELLPSPTPKTQQWDHGACETPKNGRTIRYRLSQLCREGKPNLALQLFDEIPQPKTVLWNAIIIGFVCNNMPSEALSLYARMKSCFPHTKCDFYTHSSTLKACAETRQLHIGKAIHCHVLRCHSHPSRIVCNSLLNMYSACLNSSGNELGSSDLVCRLFDSMHRRNVISWNIMIAWYVKTQKYLKAVEHFVVMIKKGIKPSVVSFINVFPAVSRMGDTRIADSFYGLLLKMGSVYANDLFAVSSAIFMYAELVCLDFARKLFDSSLERNTEVWNTMISVYVQNNHPFEALELFLDAVESEHTVLDDVTFVSALNAVSQLQQLDLVQQLHGYLIKNALISQVIVLNAIIVTYSRCNSAEMSFDVFSRMREKDVVSWNSIISAFVQKGLDDEGLILVYEMQRQGFTIDLITATALLSAASNLRNLEIGKQTHAYLLRHGIINSEGMESYLIDMYAKSGLIRTAQTFFEKNCTSDRDQATWNAMIAGNTQNRLVEQAFTTFRRMLMYNVTPNAVTLASILPACNLTGSVALGKQLHCFAIRQSLDQNIFVASALVDMYSKSGAIIYAESVFANSCDKNSVTYTNMILGYGQHGMGEKALILFYSLKDLGIEPDAITFVAVLSACSYSGLVDEGIQIFKSMEREFGIRPSYEHYCCVVDILGRAGWVIEAYDFVNKLGAEGSNLAIWGSLLAACRIHREYKLCKIVSEKLLEMEREDGVTSYEVLLSNIYAEEGNWNSVNSLRKEMRGKGLAKEIGCSWINVAGNMTRFASKDQSHPLHEKLYKILEELNAGMKDAGYRPNLQIGWDFESGDLSSSNRELDEMFGM